MHLRAVDSNITIETLNGYLVNDHQRRTITDLLGRSLWASQHGTGCSSANQLAGRLVPSPSAFAKPRTLKLGPDGASDSLRPQRPQPHCQRRLGTSSGNRLPAVPPRIV
jgi:hypothetical protein